MGISKEERERLMNAGAQAWYALRVLHVKLHEDATQPPDEIQELFSACVERITELQAENERKVRQLDEAVHGDPHKAANRLNSPDLVWAKLLDTVRKGMR